MHVNHRIMKSNWNLILAFFLMICTSCSKSELSDEVPCIPDPISIDLNDDGIVDYRIEFNFGFVFEPESSMAIIGSMIPSMDNEILHNRDTGNLFLRDLDSITIIVEEPLFWNDGGVEEKIVSISNNSDGLWPSEWLVNTEEVHETYFVGLRLVTNNLIQLGWIELDINTDTGEIEIVDKGII